MTLLQPAWLVLLVPLGIALWFWRLPSRLLQVMRIALVALVVLAMAAPAIRLPSRAGTVVVVADRSLSMPADAAATETEVIRLVEAGQGSSDRLAVVSFGRRVAVELAPGGGRFSSFVADVDAGGSDLAAAIETAVALVPPDAPGRILLLTDGRHTGRDPLPAASRAAGREVAIDHRLLQRPSAGDVAIARIEGPAAAGPRESYMIAAWIDAPVAQTVRYRLRRGDAVLAEGEREVAAGLSRLAFRDRAPDQGTARYELIVQPAADDPVPENNRARLLVGVKGARPILAVTPQPESGLVRLIRAGGVDVERRSAKDCQWDLETLAGHSAVLIENTSAGEIGMGGMGVLAAWVTEAGGGLMTTGGQMAYGPGGYFKSPLDPVLPVSMELREEHRKFALAIVVALDRSGSMTAPVTGGLRKMDLANLGTAEVVGLLSPMDEFGCLAVDSSAHEIVGLAPVTDPGPIQARIRTIESMGGGIFVYEALSSAAAMLAKARAGTRHIVLFADAADSEEPGAYVDLLEKCRQAGITVSVIGLGTPADTDAKLLEDIAKRGGGQCLFTDKAEELPRLFAQDTFAVARSAFLEETTPVRSTPALRTLVDQAFGAMPAVGGYNLCYLRPGARLAAVTEDEYEAPLVAAWFAGAGRALSYTGEADGKFTGPIGGWRDVGHFFTSLARWTGGALGDLPGEMVLDQQVRGDVCTITLHLDPYRTSLPFAGTPMVTTLSGRVTEGRPEVRKREMGWATADTLELAVPLLDEETALSSVEIPGLGRFGLPPVCLPYASEYRPAEAGQGARVLERIARTTGGEQRLDLAGIWADLPVRPRHVALGPWLLLVAMALLAAEVLERRTGLLASLGGRRRKRAAAAEAAADSEKRPAAQTAADAARRRTRRRGRAPPATGDEAPVPAPVEPAAAKSAAKPSAPEKPAPSAGLGDALREARRRATGRTRRDD